DVVDVGEVACSVLPQPQRGPKTPKEYGRHTRDRQQVFEGHGRNYGGPAVGERLHVLLLTRCEENGAGTSLRDHNLPCGWRKGADDKESTLDKERFRVHQIANPPPRSGGQVNGSAGLENPGGEPLLIFVQPVQQ